jgi:aspartate beta-hydroxylase
MALSPNWPSARLRDAMEAITAPAPKIRDILLHGRERFGRPAMERLEDAFLRASGSRPKLSSKHALQRPSLYVPGLSARPWLERSDIPGIAMLEEHFAVIRDEAFAARQVGFQQFDDGTPHTGDWNALYIRYGTRPVEKNRGVCPQTVRIVNSLPRIGPMAMVSTLNPGAHIEPHCGVHNFRITAHLGLRIPPDCTFRVGDETRKWTEGECLVFDDSFEHEVWNRSDETRFILLVDFWHPDLTDAEVDVLDQVEALMASLRSRLEEGTGALAGQTWWR